MVQKYLEVKLTASLIEFRRSGGQCDCRKVGCSEINLMRLNYLISFSISLNKMMH